MNPDSAFPGSTRADHIPRLPRQGFRSSCATVLITALATLSAWAASETFSIEREFPARGVVSIASTNGSIRISGWDRDAIRLVAEKSATDASALKEIHIDLDWGPDSLSVQTRLPRRSWWSFGSAQQVSFELQIPRGARVDQVETVNGTIELSDLAGPVIAESVNGSIRATNLAGSARIETVNGSIQASLSEVGSENHHSFSSVNGAVALSLPESCNAYLEADSVNGSIRNDFGLRVDKQSPVGSELHGRLGTGGPRIQAETVNGSIRFGKAMPASLNP